MAAWSLAGCAAQSPSDGAASEPSEPSAAGSTAEVIARATVLEGGGHGPQLCLGGVAESLPPQCGGPDIVGWSWAAVEGEQQAQDTTWGDYVVIGTYDGTAFTLTRQAVEVAKYEGPRPWQQEPIEDRFAAPCEPPPGGWFPVDAARASQADLDRTIAVASSLPGYAGLWVDQSHNSATREEELNDPNKLILVVRVTEGVEAAQAKLRETWSGALCVSEAPHTEAQLRAIQQEIERTVSGWLSIGVDRDVVEVRVIHDDGSLQARMDETHGPGTVRVISALQPYTPG